MFFLCVIEFLLLRVSSVPTAIKKKKKGQFVILSLWELNRGTQTYFHHYSIKDQNGNCLAETRILRALLALIKIICTSEV